MSEGNGNGGLGENKPEKPIENPQVVQGPTEKIEEKKIVPTDFKVAEIWIRSGQIHLDAAESFWMDKIRALGLLEYCKDIVKQWKMPEEKNKIIPGTHQMMNFVRNRMKKGK